MKRTKIYDIECFLNFFCVVFYDIHTKKVDTFVIHELLDQREELYKYLQQENLVLIGFNNLAYDYPLLHYFLTNYRWLKDVTIKVLVEKLYSESQRIIKAEWSDIKSPLIPQIDLYKIWHFDNRAKRTSLKWIQIFSRWDKVQDLPYKFYEPVEGWEMVNNLVKYCINDVMSTNVLFEDTKQQIIDRYKIRDEFNIDVINYNDVKLGLEIILKEYCQATNQNMWEVRKLRTYREEMSMNDIIFPYIEFESEKLQNFLNMTKARTIQTKEDFKNVLLRYGGFHFVIGSGGIHGCTKAGVYEADDEYDIIDVDVASLYPSIAVINNLFPKHLGIEFLRVYKDILERRLEAKRTGNKSVDSGLKLALNGAFGNSGSEYSFMYDLLYFFRTTINGQLLLIMLSESIMNKLNAEMLQINTDGITVRLKKEDKAKFMDICKQWERKTQLVLEYVNYEKMIIRDVDYWRRNPVNCWNILKFDILQRDLKRCA